MCARSATAQRTGTVPTRGLQSCQVIFNFPHRSKLLGKLKRKEMASYLHLLSFVLLSPCPELTLQHGLIVCSMPYICKLFIQPLNSSHRHLLSWTCIRGQRKGCLLYMCSWSDPQPKG